MKIDRPGRDAKVNPIEEVTVTVNATDDFGAERSRPALFRQRRPGKDRVAAPAKGREDSWTASTFWRSKTTSSLPGDLVSIYADAKDARNTTKTDIYFIQAEPFERNYSQSQQARRGQGAAAVAATIRPARSRSARRTSSRPPGTSRRTAPRSLPQAPTTPSSWPSKKRSWPQQAKSLADRMKARELADANPQFKNFAKEMEEASKAMIGFGAEDPHAEVERRDARRAEGAAGTLCAPKPPSAISRWRSEVRAVVEAAAAWAAISQNLADLELDREKNQYETGQQSASDQRAKEIDQALQKLAGAGAPAAGAGATAKESAAGVPATLGTGNAAARSRRAEEADGAAAAATSRGSNASRASSPDNSPGSNGTAVEPAVQRPAVGQWATREPAGQVGSTANPQLQQAIERLKNATEDMQNAENQQNGTPEQTRLNQRRAAKGLQESRDILNGMQHQNAAGQIDSLVQQANQLAGQQSDFQNRLRRMLGGSDPTQLERQSRSMAAEGQQMADQLKQLEKQMADTAHSYGGQSESALRTSCAKRYPRRSRPSSR